MGVADRRPERAAGAVRARAAPLRARLRAARRRLRARRRSTRRSSRRSARRCRRCSSWSRRSRTPRCSRCSTRAPPGGMHAYEKALYLDELTDDGDRRDRRAPAAEDVAAVVRADLPARRRLRRRSATTTPRSAAAAPRACVFNIAGDLPGRRSCSRPSGPGCARSGRRCARSRAAPAATSTS